MDQLLRGRGSGNSALRAESQLVSALVRQTPFLEHCGGELRQRSARPLSPRPTSPWTWPLCRPQKVRGSAELPTVLHL